MASRLNASAKTFRKIGYSCFDLMKKYGIGQDAGTPLRHDPRVRMKKMYKPPDVLSESGLGRGEEEKRRTVALRQRKGVVSVPKSETNKNFLEYDKPLYQSHRERSDQSRTVSCHSYLDFYPAITKSENRKTEPTSNTSVSISMAHPKEKFEVQYNKSMLQNAELIRCQSAYSPSSHQTFGFIDHTKGRRESFIGILPRSDERRVPTTVIGENAFKHFCKYMPKVSAASMT